MAGKRRQCAWSTVRVVRRWHRLPSPSVVAEFLPLVPISPTTEPMFIMAALPSCFLKRLGLLMTSPDFFYGIPHLKPG